MSVVLWVSVRRELRWIDKTVLLATSCMRHDWCPTVQMSDASKAGYGLMEGVFSKEAVFNVGKFDERWRFQKIFKNEMLTALWKYSMFC